MKVAKDFLLCLLTVAGVSTRHVAKSLDIQIINGTPAAPGQFPWQVILKKDAIDDLLCGASIISDTWVLTAAHCTYGLSSIHMVFGTVLLHDLRAVHMISKQLFIHPDYNDINLNNDVSLIKLPQALSFSSTIQPINLVPAAGSSETFVGTVSTIAGFGVTDDNEPESSQNLLYAKVVIIDNSQCAAIYKDVVTSSTLCAKGAHGSNMSICRGDSGGPLLARDPTGSFMQIGINSFVAQDNCSNKKYPSGYARLTSFLGYISDITGIDYT